MKPREISDNCMCVKETLKYLKKFSEKLGNIAWNLLRILEKEKKQQKIEKNLGNM